ncbi:hypothetical protein [Micromonospora sp. WMMD1082]|uniref:hypothetical protein n=1 Tax=Micromonospora sp. WMMD1082 TaxID=3016104 RepID=UPI002416172B|nr:hypothetical protein [Micromonospora sp. WMMD1082]MDG4798716.1 hypothetical protein [Micromonospora sp. WMMD1082]
MAVWLMRLTWDPEEPPAEPPEGCHDPQRWRAAHILYIEHQLEDVGAHCRCGDLWPCWSHRRAIRALLTAFIQTGPIKIAPTAPQRAICRWCRRGIAQHPVYGWTHIHDGLMICDDPPDGAPPIATAEPTA